MKHVTIVMYHYVRPLKTSSFPSIKGLELSDFVGQLDYFARFYTPITMEKVLESVKHNNDLPPNSLLLTFDDGYADHYEYVFPELQRRGWQGTFFPPGVTVFEQKILDVNKIHYILASVDDIATLKFRLFELVDQYRSEFNLLPNDAYYAKAEASRYDDKDTMFIKRMLQRFLPLPVRSRILDTLFHEFVSDDQLAFSRALYMNIEQLKEMKQAGMFIGGHSHGHEFLDALNEEGQLHEINSSLRLLKEVGASTEDWVICYPYGAYNTPLLKLLQKKKCRLGMTLKVGIANLDTDPHLELPRLDTNDFPIKKSAAMNNWTKEVQ